MRDLLGEFLGEQCEVGRSLSVPVGIFHVILRGWHRLRGVDPPEAAAVESWLERSGFGCRDGRVCGLQLRGISEAELKELLGADLFEALSKSELEELDDLVPVESALEGDSIAAFIEACCRRQQGESAGVGELYEAYKAFCGAHARPPVQLERFQKSLSSPKLGLAVAGDLVAGLGLVEAAVGRFQPTKNCGNFGRPPPLEN